MTSLRTQEITKNYGSSKMKPSSSKAKHISAILNRAKKLIEAQGKKGLDQIARENKKLGDQHVLVYKKNGINIIDPNAKRTNIDRSDVKDDLGNPVVKMIIEEATIDDGGWVHYLWTPKDSFYPQWKTTKVITVKAPDGEELILASGSFNLDGEDQFIADLVNDFSNIFKEKGKACFVEFKNKSSRVISDKLGLFMLDSKGTVLFDPGFPELESRNMYNYKDFKGNYIFRDIINTTLKKGSSWFEFDWETSEEDGSKFQLMRVYTKKVSYGNHTYIVCGGYFLKE